MATAAVDIPKSLATIDLSEYDPEQSRLMDERCILVDEEDNALGAADKKTCMLLSSLWCLVQHLYHYRSLNGEH